MKKLRQLVKLPELDATSLFLDGCHGSGYKTFFLHCELWERVKGVKHLQPDLKTLVFKTPHLRMGPKEARVFEQQ